MDDLDSVYDLIGCMHKRTGRLFELYVLNRNVLNPNGNTKILERQIKELKKLIGSVENIISGLNGIPVCGPKAVVK